MKYIVITLILFSTTMKMYAQHNPWKPVSENWKEEIAGQYGGNDGILLFEDGRFALYGYATFIMGSYTMDNNVLEFKPDVPDLYAIYAFQNPKLKDQTQIMFQGFQEGENYVQFDGHKPQLVFNKNANCFDWPFVYTTSSPLDQIAFYFKTSEHDRYAFSALLKENQWLFKNKDYNDFIFIFNKPIRYYTPFKGMLFETEDKERVLQVSENFGDRFLPLKVQKTMDEWEEVLQLKRVMDTSSLDTNAIYANEDYNITSFDPEQYILDDKTNLFIDTLNTEKDAEKKTQSFHDTRFLRKYVRLTSTDKKELDINKLGANLESIFYTTCEEPEKSYKSPNHQIDMTETKELKSVPTPPPLTIKGQNNED